MVRLSVEERDRLEALIGKGKSAAQRLLKARILLKADVSPSGEGWSDSRIITALSLPCLGHPALCRIPAALKVPKASYPQRFPAL